MTKNYKGDVMFKRIMLCAAFSVAAIFGSHLSAEEIGMGKEIARLNINLNVGVFGCPGPCYGPCYGPWYNPYYGPYYAPCPGPYYYGCRPYPYWW
jgi:hypothetical protein